MSEVLEGVACAVSPADTMAALERLGLGTTFMVAQLGKAGSFVLHSQPRERDGFTEVMESLAQGLSRPLGKALLVRYDSRVGHRSSACYANGNLTRAFQLADELYVPLDDDGEPLLDSPRLSYSELETGQDQEYETAVNAIQLGLEMLGTGTWTDIKHVLAHF